MDVSFVGFQKVIPIDLSLYSSPASSRKPERTYWIRGHGTIYMRGDYVHMDQAELVVDHSINGQEKHFWLDTTSCTPLGESGHMVGIAISSEEETIKLHGVRITKADGSVYNVAHPTKYPLEGFLRAALLKQDLGKFLREESLENTSR